MIVFPNCKINLGLLVKRRREDGYHDIETVFYPTGWKDVLEIVRSSDNKTNLFATGIAVPAENNICVQAYQLLKKQFELPPVDIHLHKIIPIGAGLGGGSADGAYTLKLLNEKFQLGLTTQELSSFALDLGSDCPFFIHNKPSLAKGRGEDIEEITLDLSRYHILIVHPGIHISTADAFAGIQPNPNQPALKDVIKLPVHEWKEHLRNDFETSIFQKHNAIRDLKKLMYSEGALYASMSGSGSAVYGIFAEKKSLKGLSPVYRTTWLSGQL